MFISPTDAQLIEFEVLPQDQPIVACNILKIKRGADGLVDPVAMASMMTYGQGMKRFGEAAGAEFIFAGMVDQLFVGPEGEDFQFLSMMRHPSRAAYLSLANDPEIQATIDQDREAGLESQWLSTSLRFTRDPRDHHRGHIGSGGVHGEPDRDRCSTTMPARVERPFDQPPTAKGSDPRRNRTIGNSVTLVCPRWPIRDRR